MGHGNYDSWKETAPTDDLPNAAVPATEGDPCDPGLHLWVTGAHVGEYCAECGWSRSGLATRERRESLRRYPTVGVMFLERKGKDE